MSRAPIISGIRYTAIPKTIGIAEKKIIVVPCIVKS